jgi:hypothetical protein
MNDATCGALDRGVGTAEPNVCVGRPQLLYITPATALDGASDQSVVTQQAMIVDEGDEILSRKVEHLIGRLRPDCGALGAR